ncbi:hypothetical protein BLNAU_6629 [Blattamonas nauphoetae]|uniref:Uncharacterized protein n=1 Tax=Blattamonas nauphoetae TaxID=2049346 RepID=A0ABQ9Y3V2_9EUKA|nr:hypothetical protein BLNAU_6629 [Blattamonas nauphoetae]
MSVIGTDMNIKSVFNLEKSYVVDQHKGRMSLLAPNSGMLVRSMPALSKALDSHNAQPESSALRSVSLLHYLLGSSSVVHAALFAFTHFPVWLIWKVCGGRPRVTQDPSLLHTNEKLTEQQGKPSRSRSGDEIVFCKHSLLIFCNCGKIFVVKFVAGECVVLTAVEKAGGDRVGRMLGGEDDEDVFTLNNTREDSVDEQGQSVLRAGCPKRVRIDLILLHVGASGVEVVRYIEMNEANETDSLLDGESLP